MLKFCRRRGRRAFSLLEVLLASMIFAVAFAGLAAGWKYHERSLQQYRNRNAARYLLQQEAERVLAHPYSNLEDGVGSKTQLLSRDVDGQTTTQEFTVESTVSENDEKTLKDISVSVSFRERNQTLRLMVHSRVARGQ